MSMHKLSSDEVAAALSQVGPTLRALSEENEGLKEKLAAFQKKERVEKLASTMQRKGLNPETSLEEKVAALMQRDNLEVIEEAVSMSAPQMKLAEVSDHPGNPGTAEGAFMASLLGG
jgi:hypothetical protein